MFFVSLSVRLSFCLSVCLYVCNIRVRVITYLNIDVIIGMFCPSVCMYVTYVSGL